MVRTTAESAIYLAVMGGFLFIPAGRLDWPQAWAYLGILTVSIVVVVVLGDPEMIRVRTGSMEKGAKRWDPLLAGSAFLLFAPLSHVIAGLDYGRFHWSPSLFVPIQLIALLLFASGWALGVWAVVTNKFFAEFVRIQKERDHVVITNGPYAYVRHPGYASAVVAYLALPVALGSLWAVVPAFAGLSLLVVRTYLEDQTLQKELNGYREYASGVRWRLVPGIW